MTTQDPHYLPPAPIGSPDGSFAWVEWYRKLREVAESGQTAYIQLTTVTDPALQGKLNKNAADVLGGEITFSSLGAFKVGNVTWNGTTVTGTGVMFTENGIVGANSGVAKFVLKGDGSATFGGSLSAASGSFSGDIEAGGSIYCTGLTNQFVTFSQTGVGTVYLDPSILSTVSTNTVVGSTTYTGVGLIGHSLNTGGHGVVGISSTVGKSGIYGFNQNKTNTSAGVVGFSEGAGVGVVGESITGKAIYGYAHSGGYSFYGDGAAYINGGLTVTGTITGTVNYAASCGVADHAYQVIPAYGNGKVYCARQTYSAQMQTDGNFVVYGGSTWASGTNVSDVRKKENIQLTSKNGLDTINALEVKDFSWKRDKLSTPNITGFIAQEVQQVIPNAVSAVDTSGNPDEEFSELLFLHKEEIIPYLVKAVQELSQELKLLKDTVNGNVR